METNPNPVEQQEIDGEVTAIFDDIKKKFSGSMG